MNADIQNIDFQNPSDKILFELCMGELTIPYDTYENLNIGTFRMLHRDILVKYDLQQYSDMLIDFQYKWFQTQNSFLKYHKDSDGRYVDELKYKLKVSKILKMFISSDLANNEALEISFVDFFDKIVIGETNLINQIKQILIKEFKRLKLNETEYTREEALEELISCEDVEWLCEFSDGIFFDGFRTYPDLIPEEIIQTYMSVHYKPREINLEIVNGAIEEHESVINGRKRKVGAQIKNLRIGELARQLSYLHSIRLFLNQSKYSSIQEYPLSNETCRFIYEYFNFWDLLYDHVKFDKSEKGKRVSYIKSLIRNNENLLQKGRIDRHTKRIIIDHILHLKIDLFRQALKGEITTEAYEEKIEALKD